MSRARLVALALLCASTSLAAAQSPAAAGPRPSPARQGEARAPQAASWEREIDRLIGRKNFGVAVREGDRYLYRHQDSKQRIPASNEKILLSMALLQKLGPGARIVTRAAASVPVTSGIIPGDLWILGEGDPAIGAERMQNLAAAIHAAGVLRVEGSIIGSTGFFKRDWRAPGWKRDFPREHIPLPTALTFNGNAVAGEHIRDPELRAAKAVTQALRKLGVRVGGKPEAAKAPAGLLPVAQVQSRPLAELLSYTNRYSSNFYAEVLGKRLGAEHAGLPGTIDKGATAIREFAASHGVRVQPQDSSGLSYANRVSAAGLVQLLGAAELEVWGPALMDSLPEPGQGTLEGRMKRLEVHAKTGTLTNISSLSGWVFLRRERVWAEFSIMSRGISKDQAMRVEDAIVRVLARSATL